MPNDVSKQARDAAFHLINLARDFERYGQENTARDLREAAYLLRILRTEAAMLRGQAR